MEGRKGMSSFRNCYGERAAKSGDSRFSDHSFQSEVCGNEQKYRSRVERWELKMHEDKLHGDDYMACKHFDIITWHCDVKDAKVSAFDLCEQYDGPHMEA